MADLAGQFPRRYPTIALLPEPGPLLELGDYPRLKRRLLFSSTHPLSLRLSALLTSLGKSLFINKVSQKIQMLQMPDASALNLSACSIYFYYLIHNR